MQRGDIFELQISKGVGHEQQGRRFGVIVQSDALLPRSAVVVAPTSASARAASIRPEVVIRGVETKILVEQVGAVDVTRLGEHIGHVGVEAMWAVDDSLAAVLGLS